MRCFSTVRSCWLDRVKRPSFLGVCDVADESAPDHDWSDRLLARAFPQALGLDRVDCRASGRRPQRGPRNWNVLDTKTRRGQACDRSADHVNRSHKHATQGSRVGASGLEQKDPNVRNSMKNWCSKLELGSWISERLSYNKATRSRGRRDEPPGGGGSSEPCRVG